MEVVTKGQFDCSTDTINGVTYGFCISYTGCGSFSNIWNYTFQVAFDDANLENVNYINVPLSTFAYDYIDDSGLQYC